MKVRFCLVNYRD